MKKFKKHGIKVVHVTIPVKVFNQEYFAIYCNTLTPWTQDIIGTYIRLSEVLDVS